MTFLVAGGGDQVVRDGEGLGKAKMRLFGYSGSFVGPRTRQLASVDRADCGDEVGGGFGGWYGAVEPTGRW